MPRKVSNLVQSLIRERDASRRRGRAQRAVSGESVDDLVEIVGVDRMVLNIDGVDRVFDVRKELGIIESDADKTLDSHAVRAAMWGNIRETVGYTVNVLEIEFDELCNSRYLSFRMSHRNTVARANREGAKAEKWTDRELNALVKLDADVVALRKKIAEHKRCLGYCTSMVRAFEQRAKMIMKWGKMTPHADDNVES